MTEGIKGMLFLDPQQERAVCYCPRCGGARFAPSMRCIRCEEDGDDA